MRKIIFIQLTYGAVVILHDVVAPKVLNTVSVCVYGIYNTERGEKKKIREIFIFSQMQNTY